MIDLTPLEVRKKKGDFRKALRGYEPALVDDFLDVVADRLEQLVRENLAMTERLNSLEHQVADNRERERALTDALVTAQEMREEMRVQTVRESELMRKTAEQETAQLRKSTEQETAQLRRTTEQEAAQMRRAAEQEVAQLRHTAEQEAAHIRSEAMKSREREEEVVRRLRARQQQLLQSYRTFLAREMAELQVIGETLEIEGLSAVEPPRPPETPRAMEMPAAVEMPRAAAMPRAPAMPRPAEMPRAAELPPVVEMASGESFVDELDVEEFVDETVVDPNDDSEIEDDASTETPTSHTENDEPVALDMFDIDDDVEEAPAPMRMLDMPIEQLQDHHEEVVHVMGALELAILEEEDEPFAPEPVDDWDEEIEPEIGAPDHDATVLLENALKAGYRLELDDEENDEGDELLLEDSMDEDAQPPKGWLDKMIDDEER